MAFLKVIDTSGTFTVPKTASYKIICVAGGNGGGSEGAGSGGDTSFGSYCTASGQWGGNAAQGGRNGYTLFDYGTIGASARSQGIGYGAGGDGGNTGSNGGACGKVNIAVAELTSGAAITCTIGAGGTAGTGANPGGAGLSGVIVVQEVG